jgi:hypothetical protein
MKHFLLVSGRLDVRSAGRGAVKPVDVTLVEPTRLKLHKAGELHGSGVRGSVRRV